jgi:SpoVK/Ycf46/Vps4 family AAA+-type ATPase
MTSPDPSVLAAICAAVDAQPENLELRAHLASLKLQSGDAQSSLEQCTLILGRKPDHLEALRLAALAASSLNDEPRAAGYRRMHSALLGGGHFGESSGSDPVPAGRPAAAAMPDMQPDKVVALKAVDGGKSQNFWEVEQAEITLRDVAGMEEVKRRLNLAFLAPLKNPELLKMYGKSLRGGLLLYGPPGCGKTFVAKAVAGELNARFIAVGLTDVLDMWLGQSERNLHEIFETARRSAPCVLFFDEIDALGRKRSLMRQSAEHNIVNLLLSEMDSATHHNDGVFILAATNHPWDVDSALRRPGRFDRMLLVLPPDRPAREAVLRLHLRGKPVEDDLDLEGLAGKTENFSGADLAHLCNVATELAMESSITTGTPRRIQRADLKAALKEIRPSTGAWFETAKNFAMFANEGGVYDELLAYLRARRLV